MTLPSRCLLAMVALLLGCPALVLQLPGQERPQPSTESDQPPPQEAPTPPQPVELSPLVFIPELPTKAVAWVNDEAVPQSDLLKLVLEQNFGTGVAALVMGKILDLELRRTGTEVTEADIDQEMEEIVSTMAPGRTVAEVVAQGQTSLKHLRQQARTNRGWKMLFWNAQKIPEDQRTSQTNQLLMQFFVRQAMEGYDRRIRGMNPAPLPGTVAQIIEKSSGSEIHIGASEALDFLIGLVKQSGLLEARDEVVDRALLRQATRKAGVEVTEQEVADWAQEMRNKHPPPFTWEQICRIKGTTPEREMERWRRIQAWKRLKGQSISDEEVMTFLEAHKSFFLGHTKKVSHILIRTTDEVTGLPLSAEKQKEAEEQINQIHGKVLEGLDFGWVAETYSEDLVTARGKGRLAQPIKEWGGGLDPTFQSAAWSLEKVGDISDPVLSRFGWHVIKLEEVTTPGNRVEPDWKEPRYWEWVLDEYETQQMNKFLEELRGGAEVKVASEEELFALKEHSFWNPPGEEGQNR